MAGHSHWSNIQHKKAAKDKKKGKVLSKLVKQIYTAVKEGGSGKPDENPRLRLVIDKCRLANMPKDNVKRAIEKAVGGSARIAPAATVFLGARPPVRYCADAPIRPAARRSGTPGGAPAAGRPPPGARR